MKTIYVYILFAIASYWANAQNVNFQWAKQLGGPGSITYGYSSAIDADGNIYIAGSFTGTVDFDPGTGNYNLATGGAYNTFICKLDVLGTFLWAKQFSSSWCRSIVVDNNGNVYTTGKFTSTVDFDPGSGVYNLTSDNNDVFISKLDALGNFVWAKQFSGALGAESNSIWVDSNGNIYTTGVFKGTTDFDPGPGIYNLTSGPITSGLNTWDIFISKLDAFGNFVWAKQFYSTSGGASSSIEVDNTGNIHLTGDFIGTCDFDPNAGTYFLSSSAGSTFVLKLDTFGNFIWAKQLGGGGSSLAVDVGGNVYTTGSFLGTADFDPGVGEYYLTAPGGNIFTPNGNAVVIKLDASGNFVWAKQFSGTSSSGCNSIFLDANNSVYTTGQFNGATDFDPGPGTFNLISTNNVDFFVSKLDTDGNFQWAKQMSGPEFSAGFGYSINVDGNDNVYTTGTFENMIDFDPDASTTNLISFGLGDAFVVKLSQEYPCTAVGIVTQPTNQLATIGGTATFSVEATGTPPFTYQWRKNGIEISGANAATYTTPALALADNNNTYSCHVTNCEGSYSATSDEATLTICTAPTIQAKNIAFNSVCGNTMTLSWANGNGTRRIVKINTSNSFTAPANGNDPAADPVYVGSGEQVVYNGSANMVTISGLLPKTKYWVRVYEANCTEGNSLYNAASADQNPNNEKTGALIDISFTTTPSCANANNGIATVNAPGGSSYLWSVGSFSTSKTIIGLATGIYTVTVTDSKGCTAVGTTTVLSNPPISAISTVSSTSGTQYSITITATGGTPPYYYQKQKPDGTYSNIYQSANTFNNLTKGVYFFMVKDAVGCTFEISETVGKAGDCPYPIIFVHGLDGDETTWDDLYENSYFKHIWGELADTIHTVNNAYLYTDIDGIGDTNLGDLNDDVLLSGKLLQSGCLYAVNMDNFWNQDFSNPLIIIHGNNPVFAESESNQSAVFKSGYVIRTAIEKVLASNQKKKKVILAGHSMGGLGAREYLQRTNDDGSHKWWDDSLGHMVAKVFTVGTPHRGSNTAGNSTRENQHTPDSHIQVPSIFSEAVRDLRYNHDDCLFTNNSFAGVYLFGGSESYLQQCTVFDNYDVNCNGNSTDLIAGINISGSVQFTPPKDAWEGTTDNPIMALPKDSVRYTYYVGNLNHVGCQPYGCGGDGVVDDQRQWLYLEGDGKTADFISGISKPVPSDGVDYRLSDRFTSENSVRHCCVESIFKTEMEDIDFLVRGFDEGDYPKFAWEVVPDVEYAGMTQIRPEKIPQGSEYTNSGNRYIDGDWFKVALNGGGNKVKLVVNPNTLASGRIDIYPAPLSDYYSNANAEPLYFKTFGVDQSLSVLITPELIIPDTFYFRITHELNSIAGFDDRANAWKTPYRFKVTTIGNFAPGIDDRTTTQHLAIGSIYPNPARAIFNLDIVNPVDDLEAEVFIHNGTGQLILEKTEVLPLGNSTLSFPVEGLPDGVYYLKIQVKDEVKTLKVMKF